MSRSATTSVKRKTAIVTGTSDGLGFAIACHLVRQNFEVIGIARREMDPSAVGDGYLHVRADLSQLDRLPALCRELTRNRPAPFALVNNAAGAIDGILPLTSDERISRAVDLDLVSPILLAKYLGRSMIAAGQGRIVNVSSVTARTGFRGLSVYSAAKAGLEGFTRSLAKDLGGRGVTVNCVAPGFLETQMTDAMSKQDMGRVRARSPLSRFATVDEVAAAVGYYLSAEAAGVTGTVLTVDAGATA